MNVPSQVKKAPLWMKITAIAVCGLAFAPIAILVIKGLFGLGIAIVLGATGYFLGPVLAEKLANMKMKGLTNEWKKNPIPTLQRQYEEKVENLKERKVKLEEFIASVSNVKTNNDAYKERFSEKKDKIALLDGTYNKLMKLQKLKLSKYEAAKDAVSRFSLAIEEAELFWNAAVAANDAAALDEADNDPMELLKTRTSLGAVQTELNKAFSELDIALLEEVSTEPKMIEAQEVQVLPDAPMPQTLLEHKVLTPYPVRQAEKVKKGLQ